MLKLRAVVTRKFCGALAIFLLLYFAFVVVLPAINYNVVPPRHPVLLDDNKNVDIVSNTSSSTTIHLVVASRSRDDVAWASNLPLRNLKVLRYVNDDSAAEYRPPTDNGREALMYLTYLCDFYDVLPDITIFVHADETPWHVEGTLLQNTTFALSQLNLDRALQRGYFNLRVTWRAGCPDWIDTTRTFNESTDRIEEPYMREAWAANFGEDKSIPNVLGGPCCSQFAVAKEAIRRRPKEQYERSRNWISESVWSDAVLGRVWEHMWPRLFTDNASDCAYPERLSLCQMYGICFTGDRDLERYKDLWEETILNRHP